MFTSNSKRLLIGIGLVWLVLEVGLRTPIAKFLPDPDASYWYFGIAPLKLEQLKAQAHSDVLFISSSLMWDAIDPRQFMDDVYTGASQNLSAYNAGLPLLDAQTTQIALDRYILPVLPKKPAYVVYGTSLVEMAQPGWHVSAVHAVLGSSAELADDPLSRRVQHWLYENIYLIRYRNTFQLLFEPIDLAKYDTDEYGFHHLSSVFDAATYLKNSSVNSLALQLDGAQFQRLQDFIHYIRQQGIQLILVDLPFAPAFSQANQVTSTLWNSYHQQLHDMANSSRVPLYDPSSRQDAWVMDNENFTDELHLNGAGAKYLTQGFAEFFIAATSSSPSSLSSN